MLKDIQNNENIKDFYLLSKKEILVDKNGRNYLAVTISDKSGSINGKMWDIGDRIFSEIAEGDIVYIEGKVDKFKDNLQIKIELIEKKEADEEIYNELIPSTSKNLETLITEILSLKNSLNSDFLKKLIDKIIFDENFLLLFKISPAASKLHHAYRGGLIEHTLAVAKLSEFFAKSYPVANRDILLTGALLHDIGKVYEYDNKTFNRTNEGKLIGHIAIGVTIVEKKASKIKNFPHELLNAVKHLILSHHGELEWGSPVQPLTIEALLLHFADNIDSKIQTFNEMDVTSSGWYFNKSLRRNVLMDSFEYYNKENKEVKKVKEKKGMKTLF